MPTSRVALPAAVRPPFTVYRNGIPQTEGEDYAVRDRFLEFPAALRQDRISGWRWFLGAWGVGTYRQHDSIDVRYQQDGRPRVAEGLDIVPSDD